MDKNNITSAKKLGGKQIAYVGDKKVVIEKKTTNMFFVACALIFLGLIPYLLTGAARVVLPFFLGSIVCSVFSALVCVLFKESTERITIDKNENLVTIERQTGNSVRIINQYNFSNIKSLNIYNDGHNRVHVSLFVHDGNIPLLSAKLGKTENYRQKFEFAYRLADIMKVQVSSVKSQVK
jgi:uncharacterized protein YqhQ